MTKKKTKTYVYIDASNLTYGGSKLLGWKIDYQKFYKYLCTKLNAEKIYFYSGIFSLGYIYKNNSEDDFPIKKFVRYLTKKKIEVPKNLKYRVGHYYKQAKFLLKLKEIGFQVKLKPIKSIKTLNGKRHKANCDLEICFDIMREFRRFDRLVLISGDGDFEILLKYCLEKNKQVIVLGNPKNTAIRIKKEFHKNFRSIQEIRESIERK